MKRVSGDAPLPLAFIPRRRQPQSNYEVGDILAGFFMPPVIGKNGYTYTLQELAFISYFYRSPSFAANCWYSNNNTLTSDAGAVCSPF